MMVVKNPVLSFRMGLQITHATIAGGPECYHTLLIPSPLLSSNIGKYNQEGCDFTPPSYTNHQ